eukprot:CAMPEP_0206222036 /NCGR_PEP_ID=MMETSP0047_2-20121206/5745_1 /ASSEMBLY_ACC=CAM_ASM_000192 /TAXON_ID=195065 /ORGANISM="Chroomonas mesostigmatica_cf, Strain CCMP1168" /LENGTH=89 /DNA_ID=CAMNT_0053644833 /DNA_START=174 /DNA_END=443 /DNA_ORIENTATION=+
MCTSSAPVDTESHAMRLKNATREYGSSNWDQHGATHGVTYRADASFYMKSSNHLALRGGAAQGMVVDARHAKGCQDNSVGFGCHVPIFS